MSYEGYSQLLCKKGHTWNVDCNEMPQEYEFPKGMEDMECPICGEKAVWENMVNVTNGSWDDDGIRIDGFVELKQKPQTSGVCSACGKKHICEETFQVPKTENKRNGVKG